MSKQDWRRLHHFRASSLSGPIGACHGARNSLLWSDLGAHSPHNNKNTTSHINQKILQTVQMCVLFQPKWATFVWCGHWSRHMHMEKSSFFFTCSDDGHNKQAKKYIPQVSHFPIFRWNMVGWPHKLETQLEQVSDSLDKDEERFHKNLLNDQTVFEDRLDELEASRTRFLSALFHWALCMCTLSWPVKRSFVLENLFFFLSLCTFKSVSVFFTACYLYACPKMPCILFSWFL